jgi:hypothetical protein
LPGCCTASLRCWATLMANGFVIAPASRGDVTSELSAGWLSGSCCRLSSAYLRTSDLDL